jgi:GxxExxY protein
MLISAELTGTVIGLAIKLHRRLGPGLLESVYEECLCFEFHQAGIAFARQVPVPVVYEGVALEAGFRADIIVEQEVILEIKSVEHLLPVHEAQVLTYLRMSGYHVGLLLNFNVLRLKDGIRRFIM